MNFTHTADINGTYLQGTITTDYNTLVSVFGQPDYTPTDAGNKTDAEWTLCFSDGTVATIYNYKNGPNYCGPQGTPVKSITKWNIGGTKTMALHRVGDSIKEAKACASIYAN